MSGKLNVADDSEPSVMLADRWEGVAVPYGVSEEKRHQLVNYYIEYFHMLERLGWYDHTGDWDFHIGVRTYDGRENGHIGDGVTLEWEGEGPKDDPLSYEDKRDFILINLHRLVDEEEAAEDQLKAYREDYGDSSVWKIPIHAISELGFGYCR